MQALLLSDIHSNIDALDAVLAAAPPYDAVWNLGDLVGYGAAPSAVLEKVRGLGNHIVRGNHDRACCGLADAVNFNSIARAAVEWTQRQLSPQALEELRQLPHGPVDFSVSIAEPSALCVHGSLLDEDQYVLTARDAAMQPPAAPLVFFGHTHVQGGFSAASPNAWESIRPTFTLEDEAEQYELALDPKTRYWINPGSVGQPRDRDWRAAFALYDTEAQRVTFYRVPYDVQMAAMRIHRADLPEMLGARLRLGR